MDVLELLMVRRHDYVAVCITEKVEHEVELTRTIAAAHLSKWSWLNAKCGPSAGM